MKRNAYVCAIELLARREHSRKELFDKLTRKCSESPAEINSILDRLVDEGYQDDMRYAQAYAHMRLGKGYGPRRIQLELKQRGIDDTLTSTVMEELKAKELKARELKAGELKESSAEFTQSNVYKSWQKKFKSSPADIKEKQKQVRYLLYRGFTMEDVNELFSYLKHECEDSPY